MYDSFDEIVHMCTYLNMCQMRTRQNIADVHLFYNFQSNQYMCYISNNKHTQYAAPLQIALTMYMAWCIELNACKLFALIYETAHATRQWKDTHWPTHILLNWQWIHKMLVGVLCIVAMAWLTGDCMCSTCTDRDLCAYTLFLSWRQPMNIIALTVTVYSMFLTSTHIKTGQYAIIMSKQTTVWN